MVMQLPQQLRQLGSMLRFRAHASLETSSGRPLRERIGEVRGLDHQLLGLLARKEHVRPAAGNAVRNDGAFTGN
jgi:hypothetical protein